MTAIASFSLNRVPVLLGDALISGDVEGVNSLRLPTISNIQEVFPAGAGFEPVDMKQKLSVLGTNLAVGWAGNLASAATVVNELKEVNERNPFTAYALNEYLKLMSRRGELDDVSLVAHILSEGSIRVLSHKVRKATTTFDGHLIFSGSCEDLIKDLNKASKFPNVSYGSVGALEVAITFSLGFNGTSLHQEIINQNSLLRFYGGAYETILCQNSSFAKIDDITYVFWGDADGGSPEGLGLRRIVKQFYHGDILCLFIVGFDEVLEGDFVNTYRIAVPPVYRTVRPGELGSIIFPGLNSKHTCHSVSMKINNTASTLVAMVQGEEMPERRYVNFNFGNNIFEVKPLELFWDRVNEMRRMVKKTHLVS